MSQIFVIISCMHAGTGNILGINIQSIQQIILFSKIHIPLFICFFYVTIALIFKDSGLKGQTTSLLKFRFLFLVLGEGKKSDSFKVLLISSNVLKLKSLMHVHKSL